MSKANETYAQPRKNVSINIFTPIHCIRRDGLVRKTKQGKTKHLMAKQNELSSANRVTGNAKDTKLIS